MIRLVSRRRINARTERWPAGSDIQIAQRGDNSATAELEIHRTTEDPSGNIDRKTIGIGQLNVFLILIAAHWIGINGTKVHNRARRLLVWNVSGAWGSSAVKRIPARGQ